MFSLAPPWSTLPAGGSSGTLAYTPQSIEFIGSYAPPPGSKVVITYATLQSSFKLSHPAAANTITVSVTPKGGAAESVPPASTSATLGWVYDSPSQSVVFPPTNIPPLGSTIEVDYSF